MYIIRPWKISALWKKSGEAFVIRPSRRLTVEGWKVIWKKFRRYMNWEKKMPKGISVQLKAWMQQEGQI